MHTRPTSIRSLRDRIDTRTPPPFAVVSSTPTCTPSTLRPQLTIPSMSSHDARAPSTISVVTDSIPARPLQWSSSVDSTEPSSRSLPGLGRSSRLDAIVAGTTPALTSSEPQRSASALVLAWRNPPVSLINET